MAGLLGHFSLRDKEDMENGLLDFLKKEKPMKKKTKKEKKKTGGRPGPIWKEITEKKPFCPKCGGPITRARGDAATLFDWECHNYGCYYVC